ncbi:MAG: DNA translocase FtsK [Hyphomicrobiaceae bacterium]
MLFVVAAVWISLLSWSANDPSLTNATSGVPVNLLGSAGAIVSDLLLQTLGIATALLLIAPMFWSLELLLQRKVANFRSKAAFYPISILILAGAASAVPPLASWPLNHGLGGILGDAVFNLFASLTSLFVPDYASLIAGLGLFAVGASAIFFALGIELADFKRKHPAPSAGAHNTNVGVANDGANLLYASVMSDPREAQHPVEMSPRPAHTWAPTLGPNPLAVSSSNSHDGVQVHAGSRGTGLPPVDPRFATAASTDAVPPAPAAYGRPVTPTAPPPITPSQLQSPIPGVRQPSVVSDHQDEETESMSESIARRFAPKRETDELTAKKTPAMLAGLKFNRKDAKAYKGPSLNLLKKMPAGKSGAVGKSTLRGNARLLEDVLSDFGIKGEIKDISPGPVVTLFEFEPARGIKSSRVIGLADDIARSMSATSARVAVVPGRNAIGIELPNATRDMVSLRGLLETSAFKETEGALPITLGKSISGDPVIADLSRMPHLLVAGTTGSGKSVGVNAMILSLLYRQSPERCRMLMIDPKMLELSVYNDIPHLLCPVVTDPHKALAALNWVVGEMEERYKRMSQMSVRNIEVYNNRVSNAQKRDERIARTVQTGFDPQTGQPVYESEQISPEAMPYIVVVVDEFADLMAVAGKDIEVAVQRLAQMARAAGIHLIMATQRPSVDVITGTIKANFPTRISFRVTSKIDSRTILNEQGAEQLLGQGDMLYAGGTGHTMRVHGPFVSDEEVEGVADFVRSQGQPDYVTGVTEVADDAPASGPRGRGGPAGNTELYDRAVALVIKDQKASTSYVQRRLSIGYNRAADLIERMEADGIIGPAGRGGKREILAPQPPIEPSNP